MIVASTRLTGTDLDFHPLAELPKSGLPDPSGLPKTVMVLLEGLLRTCIQGKKTMGEFNDLMEELQHRIFLNGGTNVNVVQLARRRV